MILKKLLDFKADVEHHFLSDEQSAADKIDAILDKRRFQLSTIT